VIRALDLVNTAKLDAGTTLDVSSQLLPIPDDNRYSPVNEHELHCAAFRENTKYGSVVVVKEEENLRQALA
jgi:hypothetical protein